MILNAGLCELIGSIIGDGNIYDKRPYYVEITGHPREDLLYFGQLLEIIKKELSYDAKIKNISGAIRIRINNKTFVNYLKTIGIPSGKGKFKKVRVPDRIIKKSGKYLISCIRGIFDTDGCVFFDKRKTYKNPYIRITLHMFNGKLLFQISKILNDLGIKNTIPINEQFLYINGKDNVKKFLKTIGFHNHRHIKKINSICPDILLPQ